MLAHYGVGREPNFTLELHPNASRKRGVRGREFQRVPAAGSWPRRIHLEPRLRRRRKIAVFCSQLLDYGGAERLVFEEATHLREAGWDVEVAALRFDPKVRFAGAYGEPVRELSGSATPGRVGKADVVVYA